MRLETYKRKRNFDETPEPEGRVEREAKMRFVVQEHHASRLHFDFRLEIGGVLKSWSVPKGPSLDPAIKRLAVETEDHPISYLHFEGRIPEGSYGAGEHMMWDIGTFELLNDDEGALEQYKKGRLTFNLKGKKLNGGFSLVKMYGRGERQWLLIKTRDEYAEDGWQLKLRLDTDEKARVWHEMMEGKTSTRKPNSKKQEEKKGVKKIKAKSDVEAIPAEELFAKRKLEGDINIKIGKDIVALTNLHKVYWEDEGYTKGDLIRFYYEVADYILPHLKDRPLIMKRYPDGIKGFSFHQHDIDKAPGYVRTANLAVEGHNVNYIVCDNTATLLYMANLGAIERHPWHSRVRNIDKPDWFVFDLDPGEEIEFQTICEVALRLRDLLDELGLESYAKTSGSRGIHIYVPVKPKYPYEEIEKLAERIATRIAEENPKVATVARSMKERKRGQMYVDYLQNARGKSIVAPYSVRPRVDATVSAPLEWKEVERKKIKIEDFTIKNMLRRIKSKGELFSDVLKNKQSLSAAVKQKV